MYKTLENFNKKFIGLKNVNPQTKAKKNLKDKVLSDAGDLFNDLYYIYKDKYNEEINSLDIKIEKSLTTKN